MKQKNIDYYLIPTGDYHGSEYVSEYFKVREFFSGFTGSNGTLLVGPLETCLWTDGRYFIQAEKELEYTGIFLQKMGRAPKGADPKIISTHFIQHQLLECKAPATVSRQPLLGLASSSTTHP